jgi:HlyD family secretion protein
MSNLMNKTKRWLWQTAKIVMVVAVIGGAIYWVKFAPLSVTQHRVERGEIVAEVMGTGTLEAHFKSTISPRISGRMLRNVPRMDRQCSREASSSE